MLYLSQLSEHLYLYLLYVWLAPVLLQVCKDNKQVLSFYIAKIILELCVHKDASTPSLTPEISYLLSFLC